MITALYMLLISIFVVPSPPVDHVPGPSLADGMMTVRGGMRHMSQDYADRLELEAGRITSMDRYRWITPWLLIGLAINESDLRPSLRHGADCGLTQIRVTVHAKGQKSARRLCDKLTRSTFEALRYAAEELTYIRDRYCSYWWSKFADDEKYEPRFRRCVLNIYNQGPWYYKEERCTSTRCHIRARYWVRVSCFAAAVFHNKKALNCRKAYSDRQLRRKFGRVTYFVRPGN